VENWKEDANRLRTMKMDDCDYLKALVASMPRRLS
jgi:hypothetical protein